SIPGHPDSGSRTDSPGFLPAALLWRASRSQLTGRSFHRSNYSTIEHELANAFSDRHLPRKTKADFVRAHRCCARRVAGGAVQTVRPTDASFHVLRGQAW